MSPIRRLRTAEGDDTLAEEPNLFTCFEATSPVAATPPTGHSSLTLSVGLGDMRKSNMTMFWSDIRDMICIATRSNVGPPLCLFYFDTGSQKEFKCLNHQLHSFSLGGGSVMHSQSVGEKNSQLHADRLLLPW